MFPSKLSEIEYDILTAENARSLCRRYAPEAHKKLQSYDKRLERLYFLKEQWLSRHAETIQSP